MVQSHKRKDTVAETTSVNSVIVVNIFQFSVRICGKLFQFSIRIYGKLFQFISWHSLVENYNDVAPQPKAFLPSKPHTRVSSAHD
jgi:hypothetical protein